MKCRANLHPMPSASLPPGEWLLETARHMMRYEPCNEPATHTAYGGDKPLCPKHAEEMRAALRSPDSLGNVMAGRARTEEEIAGMVREIPS